MNSRHSAYAELAERLISIVTVVMGKTFCLVTLTSGMHAIRPRRQSWRANMIVHLVATLKMGIFA